MGGKKQKQNKKNPTQSVKQQSGEKKKGKNKNKKGGK
jgi:hypothetical protein